MKSAVLSHRNLSDVAEKVRVDAEVSTHDTRHDMVSVFACHVVPPLETRVELHRRQPVITPPQPLTVVRSRRCFVVLFYEV